MKSLNDMNHVHNKDLNNISEFNLLNGIQNYSKHTKTINIHYSTCMYEFK